MSETITGPANASNSNIHRFHSLPTSPNIMKKQSQPGFLSTTALNALNALSGFKPLGEISYRFGVDKRSGERVCLAFQLVERKSDKAKCVRVACAIPQFQPGRPLVSGSAHIHSLSTYNKTFAAAYEARYLPYDAPGLKFPRYSVN
ncbi:MAG: hypothetical protein LBQ51_00890 [Desulfovibrio sp.]|jgi:hypothetical protein|nr:hypothetical protein [Desulfovibrio sp.]